LFGRQCAQLGAAPSSWRGPRTSASKCVPIAEGLCVCSLGCSIVYIGRIHLCRALPLSLCSIPPSPSAYPRPPQVLLDLIKTRVAYVVQEGIVVIKDCFRRYPNKSVSTRSRVAMRRPSPSTPRLQLKFTFHSLFAAYIHHPPPCLQLIFTTRLPGCSLYSPPASLFAAYIHHPPPWLQLTYLLQVRVGDLAAL
jgi:hypothetical protein